MWYREELIMSDLTKKKLFNISNAVKRYSMDFFDIEAGEFSLKEIITAGVSLVIALIFVFMPLFV